MELCHDQVGFNPKNERLVKYSKLNVISNIKEFFKT